VLQITGNVFDVGLTSATIFLPGILVGPVAGVFVDRFNRRAILLLSNIFQGIIVAGIAVLYSIGELQFSILLVLLFLLNAGAQFVRPTVSAVIPSIMAKDDLAPANSLFTISGSLNQIAGFSIGGVMILLLGVVVPIYYDSLTFIFAALTVTLIATSALAIPSLSGSFSVARDGGSLSFKERFLEGVRFIKNSRFLLELIALAIVLNFFAGGVQTLVAPYAKLTVHGNAFTYGALLAGLSLGSVIGAIAVGKVQTRNYVGKLLFGGVLIAGIAVALMGLTDVAEYAFVMMLVIGLSLAMVNLPLQVLIQARVPGDMLGRVFTSLGALVTIATPVAALTTGSVATSITIGSTLFLYGGLMALVAGGAYFVFGEVRDAKY
jgi:MFS transporter, DHA3 family, macrolide efflux protein